MADIKAAQSGNWNAPATWSGGVVPVAGDVAYANGFTVTLNVNVNAATLTNAAGGTVTAAAGGSFTLSPGITLTANVVAGSVAIGCVNYSGAAGQTASIAGNVTGGTVSNSANGVNHSGAGTLNISGTVLGGTAGVGISQSGGTLNITGKVGPANSLSTGVSTCVSVSNSSCVLVVNGDVQGSTGVGVSATAMASLTVNGNVICGSINNGVVSSASNCTISVTGRVYGNQMSSANASLAGLTHSGINSTLSFGSIEGGFSMGVNVTGGLTNTVTTGLTQGSTVSAFSGSYGLQANCNVTVNGAVKGVYGPGINSLAGVVTINGDVYGPISGNNIGFAVGTAAVTHTVTGNVFGGGAASAISISAGTINIVGNVQGGTASSGVGVTMTLGANANVTGNVTGGLTGANYGITHGGSGTLTVFGDITGGAGANNAGFMAIYASNTGPVNVWGSAYASSAGGLAMYCAAANVSSFVQRVVGQDYPNGGITTGVQTIGGASFAAAITVDALVYGSGGMVPVQAIRCFFRAAGNNYITARESNAGPIMSLGEPTDMPAIADVRYGTVYNFGNLTGTLKVPPAGSVALGVPVDATVGSAALSPAALVGASLLTRLQNCATVQSTGDQLAALSP